MNLVVYTCQRCTKQFERQRKKKGYRYCSQKCANARQTKLTVEMLRPYAERGTRLKIVCFELGVVHTTVCRAFRALGLRNLWASNRYKKCASRKVGSTSAIAASATANSPLSGSAQPRA